MTCGKDLAYIMEDEAAFFATEYKVLQSRTDSCFVRCMKMSWNGKLMLLYLTDQYKPLSSLLGSLGAESFMAIVSNLLGDIADVLDNGFLNSSNIDINPEHIYVEPATLKVKLIYVPSKERLFGDDVTFEEELRSCLVKLILENQNLISPKTQQLKANLSNGKIKFKDLLMANANLSLKTAGKEDIASGSLRESGSLRNSHGVMKISALNAPFKFELLVSKDRFVIGKKTETCDGVIGYNKMISRNHCLIEYSGSVGYTVTDMNSVNGTFLNGYRLESGQPVPVKNGDLLRLADSDFKIIII